jgi:hypothetical protein
MSEGGAAIAALTERIKGETKTYRLIKALQFDIGMSQIPANGFFLFKRLLSGGRSAAAACQEPACRKTGAKTGTTTVQMLEISNYALQSLPIRGNMNKRVVCLVCLLFSGWGKL